MVCHSQNFYQIVLMYNHYLPQTQVLIECNESTNAFLAIHSSTDWAEFVDAEVLSSEFKN